MAQGGVGSVRVCAGCVSAAEAHADLWLTGAASARWRAWLCGDLALQVGELFGDAGVGFGVVIDGADGVEDGGVVAAAEVAADFLEGEAGMAAGEEHADLAGESD